MTDTVTVPLGQLCASDRSICYGIVQPGKPVEGGVPIVRVNNFHGNRVDLTDAHRVDPLVAQKFRRSQPKPNDVLVSLVGTIGQVAIAPDDIGGWNLARAVGLLPARDEHHSRWVYYALQSPAAQSFIRAHANTTVQATFNLQDLVRLPVPYPHVELRTRIIEVLSALDDKIELNRRMNETLEAMAQAIFRDWFVDFGPTRRKLEGATDPVTIMGGLVTDRIRAQELADFFPATLGDDGLPVGWRDGCLGDIASSVGTSVNPAEVDASTPYIGLEHMPRRSIALGEWGPASKVTSNKSAFKRGQVLFGKLRPYFHKVGIAPVDGVCSTDIIVLDGTSDGLRPLVALCVASEAFVAFTDQGATGTKMPRTSWNNMKSYPLALAADDVVSKFSEMVAPLLERVVANVHENRTLSATRDFLLPKLLSGKVHL